MRSTCKTLAEFYFIHQGQVEPPAFRIDHAGNFYYHQELIGNDRALADMIVACCSKFINDRNHNHLTVELIPELVKMIFEEREKSSGQKPQHDPPS